MLFAIDIGNSNVVFGIYREDRWEKVWRIQTDLQKTADEYEVIFRTLLSAGAVSLTTIGRVVISSVVPSLLNDFCEMIRELLSDPDILVVSPAIYACLPITIQNPNEIGTDLVANATAAYSKYHCACMVIDFGTALTFTTLSDEGCILGVAIAPGLKTAMKALAGNTAQLPHVQLVAPPSVLGQNTVHAIQSGLIFGYSGMIDRLIDQTTRELGKDLRVIATGGMSSVLAGQLTSIQVVDKNLTLEGLRIIGQLSV